ncbi:VacJ family lipoprotein [Pseudogemmobacter sp. W21_MBD1_M6]
MLAFKFFKSMTVFRCGAVICLLSLAACAERQLATGINDPYEAANRARFKTLVEVDRVIIRPTSQAYGAIVPEPARSGVSNLSSHFGVPADFVNNVLQGDVKGASTNVLRFAVNTLFGFAGLLDPATEMGLPKERADFGQTLHVWGAKEGAYLVIPLLGPSTTRDAVGSVVDLFTNPLSYALSPPESRILPAAKVGSRLGDRYRFAGTVDSIFYDSADGYAQARILYLQSRRFELGSAVADDYVDPYEDPYAQ